MPKNDDELDAEVLRFIAEFDKEFPPTDYVPELVEASGELFTLDVPVMRNEIAYQRKTHIIPHRGYVPHLGAHIESWRTDELVAIENLTVEGCFVLWVQYYKIFLFKGVLIQDAYKANATIAAIQQEHGIRVRLGWRI